MSAAATTIAAGLAVPLHEWLQALGAGALFGLLGQAVRVIPGTYKRAQAQSTSGSTEPFSLNLLLVSLLLGATAGALAALTQVDTLGKPTANISITPLLALMAAGYAGADFIEGFAGRYLRQGAAPDSPAATKHLTAPDATGAVG